MTHNQQGGGAVFDAGNFDTFLTQVKSIVVEKKICLEKSILVIKSNG